MKINEGLKLTLILSITYIIIDLLFIYYCLFVNPSFPTEVPDQENFVTRGNGVLSGLLPYRDFYTNAAPLSPYMWAIIVLISNLTLIRFDFTVRLFFSLCLILSSLLLFKIQKNKENPQAFTISLIYGLNPYFLYLTSIWGSDECILPLLLLVPIYLFEKDKPTMGTFAVALGAGIKYFPILLAPLIWGYGKKWKKRILEIFILLFLVALTFLPFYFIAPEQFLFQFQDPIQETLGGNQGILSIIQGFFDLNLETFSFYFKIATIIALTIVGLVFLFKRRNSYMDAFPFIATFLILYTKFQISYIVLVFPFLIEYIIKEKKILTGLFFYATIFPFGEAANGLIAKKYEQLFLIISSWMLVITFYLLFILLVIFHFTKTGAKFTIPDKKLNLKKISN